MNSKEARIKELEGLLPDLRQVACDAGYYGLAARIDAILSQQAEPASAQDERGAYTDWYKETYKTSPLGFDGSSDYRAFHAGAEWQRTRPAQDERETVEVVGYTYAYESGAYSQYPGEDWLPLMTVTQHERIVGAPTRPAQKVDYINTSEQQPIGYANYRDGRFGSWLHPTAESAANFDKTALSGKPAGSTQVALYAAPITQTEPAPAQDEQEATSADYLAARTALESCDWSRVPIGTKEILGRVVDLLWLAAHAAPQPEQSNEA